MKVTEQDFMKEEYKGKNVEDYEFRGDGELVRKDRWEMGIRKIQRLVLPNSSEFEIDELIMKIDELVKK